ncbi:MAG: hypothetical protein RBG13Loki_0640 [Promethearchaeota archaeon CR_4]|nr:MAG: hypothetical protein RBG13Loki_0640 [Candidatus Lokiarchaeota archaeon CR_4]
MMLVQNTETTITTDTDNYHEQKRVQINWGRQGGVFLAYAIVLLGYYGIVANFIMYQGNDVWLSFTEMDRTVLFWTFNAYGQTYFLPIILLFLTCFILTYKEEIPHYGIKASIWVVPLIIVEAFVLYSLMFGFSIAPIIYQFGDMRGYFHILILIATTFLGAICGMKTKQFVNSKRNI